MTTLLCRSTVSLLGRHVSRSRHVAVSWRVVAMRRSFSSTTKDDDDEQPHDTKLQFRDKMPPKKFPRDNTTPLSEYTVEDTITMPLLDLEDMHEVAVIEEWWKKEGDLIHYDDQYVDVTLDDITFGMQHDDEDSVLLKEIITPAGTQLKTHDPMCIILRKAVVEKGKGKDEEEA